MKKAQLKIMFIMVFFIPFINVYAQSNPYELVSGYSYEDLYKNNVPNANHFDEFGIFDLETIGDNIYFGMGGSNPFGAGNPWTNITRGVLGKIEGVNAPKVEGVLDDEGFLDMKKIGNELVINGTDATDYVADFRIGFNYTYTEADGLTKYGEEHSFRQIKKTITDENGNYSFYGLASDYYFVRFVRPADFVLSPKISDGPCTAPVWTDGSTWVRKDWKEQADALDNDAEYKTDPLFNGHNGSFPGAYVEVSGPSAGSPFPYVNNNIDCGLTPALGEIADEPYNSIPIIEFPSVEPRETVIGGKVWNDTNGDGHMDPNESGVAGVQVEIYSYGYYFPNALHSFGVHVDEENAEAYIPMGIGSNTVPIYKYTQKNKNWSLAGNIPAANRSWRLSKLNDTWYSKHNDSRGTTLCSPIAVEDEGDGLYYSKDLFNWFLLSDDFDRNSNYNFVPYRNRLVHRKKTNSLESIQDDQTLQEHILPEELHSLGYNAVTSVSNDYVYLGTETGAIYRSADLSTWSYMGTTQNPVYSLHYWEEKNALLIGTGESSNGKIYRMDDVGDQIFQCGTDNEAFSLYVEQKEDQYSLNWDELSAGIYTIRIFDHDKQRWYSIRTRNNSYTFDTSSLSIDSTQFDFFVAARCLSTRQIFRTTTVSVGDNCCELSCKPFNVTAHWNTRIDDDVDFNWTSISGSSLYQIYWSTNNNDWNLLEDAEAISTSDTYFDGDNVRGFMEENEYDVIYLRVRALCETGEFYDSTSTILNRFTSTTASKEVSNTINNASIKSVFTLAPNPVNDITTMTVLENIEQYNIDIFNLNGQNVYHVDGALKLQNDQIELNLSHLPTGVYMLTLKSPKYTKIVKVLVN